MIPPQSHYTAIANVMMVGDKKKYNTCLVTLKTKGATGELPGTDDLDGDALNVSPGVTKLSKAMKDPKVLNYMKAALNAANADPKVGVDGKGDWVEREV